MRHQDKGDVLVFGYEIVREDVDRAQQGTRTLSNTSPHANPLPEGEGTMRWDAAGTRDVLRGEPGRSAGGCTSSRSTGESRRLQRTALAGRGLGFLEAAGTAGAEFVFLSLKSGRYHVRADSLSRVPRLTARQRKTVVANWEAGRPIFDPHA